MERCFIVSKESKYFKDITEYSEKAEKQRTFVDEFFIEKGLDGESFRVRGNGFVNVPFDEFSKSEIELEIEPTENNLSKFGKMLCKENKYGLCTFRKSSKIAKEFAQKCVDKEIPINLDSTRISDYFESLSYGIYGCNSQRFIHNDVMYLKVDSSHLTAEDTPIGFTEIKVSEFYTIMEDYKEKKNK